ncbi:MAG TPA: M14 family metallopeptidase [Vicinamibacterales bacterium]|nr:M14 family metallopeptidase [Vicinamibacterales bacterium]
MRRIALLILLLAVSRSAAAQQPITVGGVTAAPGAVASGTLDVPARAGDSGTTIPVTVINGASSGPVLALIAGTHGMEYVPIVALQRLRTAIDAKAITGAVIMVHVANMPSFLGRTIYYSPVDGKNLNRVYPGKADGTISERIAETITREVIARATHVVDLHCGDGNESLRPYSYWITTGDPKVAQAGRAMALAFGLEHIVVDRERPTDPANSVYTSNTAITRGKPALTTETGGMAIVDEASIELVRRGVAGLMKHLGMRTDGPAPVAAPVLFERNEVLRAGATGIFYAAVEKGREVKKGARLGHITDFHGRTIEEVIAPFDGQILYVVGTPPVTKGEPVAMIGGR